MTQDFDKLLSECIKDGIRKGIAERLNRSYDNPLDKVIDESLKARNAEIRSLLNEALTAAMSDIELREQIKTQVRQKLANIIVARFGGELEKQVNVLKSDPTTRARITVAIEELVKEKLTATA